MLFFDSDVTLRELETVSGDWKDRNLIVAHIAVGNLIESLFFNIHSRVYRLPAAPLNLSSVCHHKLPRPLAPRV